MSRRFLPALLIALLPLAACETAPTDTGDLDTLDDQIAYIIGHGFGADLNEQIDAQDMDLDRDLILAAAREGLRGDSMRIAPTAVDSIMRAFQDTLMARVSQANMEEGTAFLAEVAGRDGVQRTESGLLYEILEEGTGDSPQLGETVVVDYRGTLPDDTEFDSSARRGEPARFVVGEVIPGWNEALQLMKPGSRWKLYVPSDLAYGEQARSQQIGPNQVLVFEVDLLDVNPDQ